MVTLKFVVASFSKIKIFVFLKSQGAYVTECVLVRLQIVR